MDEIWERAVETALEGQTDHAAARALTLDGAVKCVQGRLPPPSLLEKFQNLQHLSIANVGVSSLEQFPRLRNLQKLILSDNRIAGGLEFLVEAGLDSLRDLDLSNNRIQQVEDLAPLAQLRLVSLDLYECPVTHVKDYRSRVFGLIKSLKYLDKMDADENERPESDDEEEDEEDEEDDPGSGEIDGEERPFEMTNGHSEAVEGVVDVDEDEESDADEEETVTAGRVNGVNHPAENGFRFAATGEDGDEDEEEPDEDDENDSGEEIDEDGEDDDVVEVHEIEDSDDEEDGVEYDEDDDDDDDDEDDEEEEVDNDEGDLAEPESTGRLTSMEGEIDGHEQGEDDDADEDDNGETGEEEQLVEEDGEFEDEDGDEEEEDYGAGYLVQPVAQAEEEDAGGSDMDPGNEEGDGEEEEVEDEKDDEVEVLPPSSSSQLKRKRDGDADSDDNGEDDEEDDDVVEYSKSSKKHPKARESSDESTPTIAEIAAIAGGLISTPVIGWSLYTLKTTGCGLQPGPGGSIGALEGVSYLAVLGIVGWSLYTKTKTGSGLPNGPFGLLGAVEGLSYLSLLSILVVFGLQFVQNGSIPGCGWITLKSFKMFFNHVISQHVVAMELYSASALERDRVLAIGNQVPIFSSTQAKNFFSTVATRKVVHERQIIWDDLSLADVIRSDDLVEQYRLHKPFKCCCFQDGRNLCC
ncbi:acidic leucine-rich nuclear phosphoprotein 32-related protein-like [Pyrus ussuriensis x Pyrus communis]|uniref:Acidic leucine-rich nuclear phosphoprotein 32-related protein-like n=1 Tax=Pyrus ussuriensis x Pyrus communis TaxID=2448454 RepID=A0A5N5GWG0_9ROSA|nr:acidic leucine-rich nuclear phosphoprotein 32-related protein-like [Pyrus ussuriensis x Pyrus communis]